MNFNEWKLDMDHPTGPSFVHEKGKWSPVPARPFDVDLWYQRNLTQKEKEFLFKEGLKSGIEMYAFSKDGIQQVGTAGNTLQWAQNQIDLKGIPTYVKTPKELYE